VPSGNLQCRQASQQDVALQDSIYRQAIASFPLIDDDPYAEELRESFKNFVPHTVPRK
ncbi:unnamed protein product, partial [Ixodes hexagonus]